MKALHKAAIIMKKALHFRKAIFGAKFANKADSFIEKMMEEKS